MKKEVKIIPSPEAKEVYDYLIQEAPNSKTERVILKAFEHKKGLIKMIPDEAKQIVMTRYDKFAETGGSKDSC